MASTEIASFEIQIEDVDFNLLKNALEKFHLRIIAPHKISSFLDIVSEDFDDNLTVDQKYLVAFVIRRILTCTYDCIRDAQY